jgi:hypothetical protein
VLVLVSVAAVDEAAALPRAKELMEKVAVEAREDEAALLETADEDEEDEDDEEGAGVLDEDEGVGVADEDELDGGGAT